MSIIKIGTNQGNNIIAAYTRLPSAKRFYVSCSNECYVEFESACYQVDRKLYDALDAITTHDRVGTVCL